LLDEAKESNTNNIVKVPHGLFSNENFSRQKYKIECFDLKSSEMFLDIGMAKNTI